MSVSKTSICNSALARLGEKTVNDVETPDTPAGVLLNRIWDQLVDELLADGPEKGWRFAIHRKTIGVSSDEPEFDFDYQFEVPSSPHLLRIVSVQVGGIELTDWIREGDYILTDQEETEIDMIYVKRVTDVSKFPPYFIKALYMRLAVEIAFNVIQSATRAADLIIELDDKILPRAIALDSQEIYVKEYSTDWVDAGHVG